ncbi:hypothetical protein A3F86_03755 [candidate division WOR-1 bacterium RIFCSPLOWO2_12_FULL_45_9]|uniref:histidine kinase n=1 Tax=candidate division WOR-1 bacterium RIFCSPLOWO2_12_FULL_45_9 TaxID=1802568 RepID=A0A1F4RPF6_UNCSA|nr:MAG: hypothetical protein A3F86_03755 [candidate division WOR-1 bacterium RIFCSPLOWO2_12_FULL_45_9]
MSDKQPAFRPKFNQSWFTILIITLLIFAVEFLIMLPLRNLLPFTEDFFDALLNAALLIIFILPFLYQFLFRPLVSQFKELQAVRQFDEALLRAIPFPIDIVDATGGILYLNDKMKELVGDNVLGSKCWDNYRDNKEQCPHCPLFTGIKTGETVDIEIGDYFEGKTMRIFHTGMVFQGKNAVLEIFMDITERNKAAKLIDELAKFPAENPLPVMRVSTEGILLYANRACKSIMAGWCSEGNPVPNVLKEKIYSALKTKQPLESEYQTNGRVFLYYIVPLVEQCYVNLYGSDITERKKIDLLKTEFVSTVSHELRTPLALIKEGVSIVLDGLYGKINKDQKKLLSIAKSNVDRLARIINELLDISKIEAHRVELNRSQVDICAVAARIIEQMRGQAEESDINLTLKAFPQAVELSADSDRLEEVFINLFSNAIKFTPKNGTISVEIVDKDSLVEVSVADTGRGISEADLPRVFSKFEQFGRTPGPGIKGTGLGLSIVKGLIELHGGNIRVESQPGKGTKFIFTLPKAEGAKDGQDRKKTAGS